ncbi:protein WVD2-like 7 isoform X2 [Brassica rapa]|uniref:protein WVD2-like 7 isoform X2 n=1 Tax=Brassica campestris TaxID=3711 RepID=UPI00142D71CB|nr:protein WVD2-like 7 isoform X2 [Brassica rapa]
MGDMEVAIASGEDKIMKANKEMQVSVSFGKFENDSLSWEKFSSFSPNKYLEEVEKCATPGSVAQKKAYFESHYKKIAERNAEIILEQEKKQLERNQSFRQSLENSGNRNSVMIESSACYGSDGESTSEKDRIVNSIAAEENDTCNHEPLEETIKVEVVEDLSTLKMEKLEEIVCVEEMEDKEKPEEVVFIEEEVKEDISSKDTPLKETKKKGQHLTKNTDTNVRTNHTRTSPKPNQVTKKPVASRKTQLSKEKSMIKATTTTTNKAASPSPVSKASKYSTPRVSKPASTTTSMSTSRFIVKKENVSALPRKKQTAPKTLHTSLNLNQPSSDPTALATTRKSLIMERMGDKEIVRRAFKTFQKSFDQVKPSQDTAPKQVPAKATSVSKLATTGLKDNGRYNFDLCFY